MGEIKFSYYPADITKCKPLGEVTLEQYIRANQKPNKKIQEVFAKIAQAERDKDFKTKAELKTQNLYYFNPCVQTDGQWRSYSNIKSFTGILVVDIDHIDDSKQFRDEFFEEYKCCIACLVSPSKKGVKALIKIRQVDTIEEFKELFFGLAHHLEIYEGFDVTGQSPILPLFLSFDPDLKYRPYAEAETWTKRGFKIDAFPVNGVEDFEIPENISPEDTEEVKSIFRRSIDKITSNGHPQLRSTVLALSGFCASSYIDYDSCIDLITECIEGNDYLSRNSKGYLKTSYEMMKRGANSPLLLNKHKQ